MNNRITELAIQADIWCDQNIAQDAPWYKSQWERKFAELLIQDCCKVIQEWKKEPFPFDEDLAVELIHQNFGLELPPKNIKVIKI
jgi:hypothetical protein